MNHLPNDIYEVVKETELKYNKRVLPDDFKDAIEKYAKIDLFDGGAFLSFGQLFDLYVLPERRGRWRIRSIVNEYIERFIKERGRMLTKINKLNTVSLRLASGFGFIVIDEYGDDLILEKL